MRKLTALLTALLCCSTIYSQPLVSPGAPADPHVAWARAGWERIQPFSTGGNYVNFQLADDDATRTAAAYGSNYQRLQQVKAIYDPDNLFRVNRNIPPAA